MTADKDFNVGFMSVGPRSVSDPEPQLVKFNLMSLQQTGRLDLAIVQGYYETAVWMSVHSENRTMVVLMQGRSTLRLVSYNLFGIRSIFPSVVDMSGGAIVTVHGEGFPVLSSASSSGTRCHFMPAVGRGGTTTPVPARLISTTQMVCVAPASLTVSEQCGQQIPFNIRVLHRSTNVTNVFLARPLSAIVTSATGPFGGSYCAEGTACRIYVKGYDFVPSASSPQCRLSLSVASNKTHTTPVVSLINSSSVTVFNTTHAMCVFPPSNTTPAGTQLIYSHDGTSFGSSSVSFVIVGAIRGITNDFREQQATGGLRADTVTPVPPFSVYAVDANGNRAYMLDSVPRQVSCTLQNISAAALASVGGTTNAESNNTAMMVNGVADVSNFALLRPSVGSLTFACETSIFIEGVLQLVSTTLSIKVVEGSPSALLLLTNTSSWLVGVTEALPLHPPPTIALADSAGNVISGSAISGDLALPQQATAEYFSFGGGSAGVPIFSDKKTIKAVIGPSATFTFVDLSIRSVFGVAPTILFSLPNSTTTTRITPLVVSGIALERCEPGAEYAVDHTFSCLPCPHHGICDGTAKVEVEPGYWRASAAALTFYPCMLNGACASATRCSAGYTGPLCGICAEGYGRESASCSPCQNRISAWTQIVLFMCIYVGLATAIYRGSQRDASDGKVQPLSLVFKIALTHFQSVGLIPIDDLPFPPYVQQIVKISRSATQINPNLSFLSCQLFPDIFATMYLSSAAPILLVGVLVVGLAAHSGGLALRDFLKKRRKLREREARAKKKNQQIISAAADKYLLQQRSDLEGTTDLAAQVNDGADEEVEEESELDENERNVRMRELRRSRSMLLLEQGELDLDHNMDSYAFPMKKRKDSKSLALGAPTDMAASTRRGFVESAAVMTVIALFLLFPTVVQSCASIFPCLSIDFGNGIAHSVMRNQPNVDCSGDTYLTAQRNALLLFVAYVVGVPVVSTLFILGVSRVLKGGDMLAARQLFFFTTGGFVENMWFWESVAYARKAALLLVVSLFPTGQLRIVICMWICGASIFANHVLKPWSENLLQRLENMSFIMLFITFGVVAASYTIESLKAEAAFTTASVLADVLPVTFLLVNLAALVIFVAGAVWAAREKVIHASTKFEIVQFFLNKLLMWYIKRALRKNTALKSEVTMARDSIAKVYPRVTAVTNILDEYIGEMIAERSEASMRKKGEYIVLVECNGALEEVTRQESSESMVMMDESLITVASQTTPKYSLQRWIRDALRRHQDSNHAEDGAHRGTKQRVRLHITEAYAMVRDELVDLSTPVQSGSSSNGNGSIREVDVEALFTAERSLLCAFLRRIRSSKRERLQQQQQQHGMMTRVTAFPQGRGAVGTAPPPKAEDDFDLCTAASSPRGEPSRHSLPTRGIESFSEMQFRTSAAGSTDDLVSGASPLQASLWSTSDFSPRARTSVIRWALPELPPAPEADFARVNHPRVPSPTPGDDDSRENSLALNLSSNVSGNSIRRTSAIEMSMVLSQGHDDAEDHEKEDPFSRSLISAASSSSVAWAPFAASVIKRRVSDMFGAGALTADDRLGIQCQADGADHQQQQQVGHTTTASAQPQSDEETVAVVTSAQAGVFFLGEEIDIDVDVVLASANTVYQVTQEAPENLQTEGAGEVHSAAGSFGDLVESSSEVAGEEEPAPLARQAFGSGVFGVQRPLGLTVVDARSNAHFAEATADDEAEGLLRALGSFTFARQQPRDVTIPNLTAVSEAIWDSWDGDTGANTMQSHWGTEHTVDLHDDTRRETSQIPSITNRLGGIEELAAHELPEHNFRTPTPPQRSFDDASITVSDPDQETQQDRDFRTPTPAAEGEDQKTLLDATDCGAEGAGSKRETESAPSVINLRELPPSAPPRTAEDEEVSSGLLSQNHASTTDTILASSSSVAWAPFAASVIKRRVSDMFGAGALTADDRLGIQCQADGADHQQQQQVGHTTASAQPQPDEETVAAATSAQAGAFFLGEEIDIEMEDKPPTSANTANQATQEAPENLQNQTELYTAAALPDVSFGNFADLSNGAADGTEEELAPLPRQAFGSGVFGVQRPLGLTVVDVRSNAHFAEATADDEAEGLLRALGSFTFALRPNNVALPNLTAVPSTRAVSEAIWDSWDGDLGSVLDANAIQSHWDTEHTVDVHDDTRRETSQIPSITNRLGGVEELAAHELPEHDFRTPTPPQRSFDDASITVSDPDQETQQDRDFRTPTPAGHY